MERRNAGAERQLRTRAGNIEIGWSSSCSSSSNRVGGSGLARQLRRTEADSEPQTAPIAEEPMAHIVVEDLVKTFRVAEREAGFWGAVRGLARRRTRTVHALERVSFTLQPGELVGYIGPN